MSIRKLFFLLLLLLGAFLIVKFDLVTMAKIRVSNMIYGNEMRGIDGFRIVAEVPNPEVERDGLTRRSIRESLITPLAKAGVKNLSDELWNKTPGRPSLVISVQALQQADRKGNYQYMVSVDVTKSKAEDNFNSATMQKADTIWSASEVGLGSIDDIRQDIIKLINQFLKAHASS